MKTTAIFFPFDLFGSAGCRTGAELLADAFEEMLADNRREKKATRAGAYQKHVSQQELAVESLEDHRTWRERARQAVRKAWAKRDFLLWITGNHLGVLPVYDELAGSSTLVVQLDAHLDIYNLSDCKTDLSHGNFLLHAEAPLPAIMNLGARELLLRPDYIKRFYRATVPAAELAIDPEPALGKLREACAGADRVFIDIDCDVLDPASFPAVTQPVPFGLCPAMLLRILDAAWSDRVCGVALSEFDPARDHNDQCLATLVWLLEYLLLRMYEM